MRTLPFLGAAVVLAFGASAHANTFTIDYQAQPEADPAENFEADCLGATPAEDCSLRAALLKTELMELLSSLEGRRDAATIALFQQAVSLRDPKLSELGIRYFEYYGQVPPTVWDLAKEFFFGTNPGLGAASADLMQRSEQEVDIALAEHYLEGRPSYGSGVPAAGEHDAWASRQAKDALIEAMLAFEMNERFQPATRLLMNDRLLSDYKNPNGGFPVTGFVTDSSLEELSAFFSKVFGKPPYPSFAETQLKLKEYETELEALQARLEMGDFSAASRLTEIVDEMTPIQEAASFAELYDFEDQKCTDHVFWVDGSFKDGSLATTPRAVAIGKDALIGRNVIRYISGQRSSGPQPNDGEPDGGTDEPHDRPDAGSGEDEAPRKKGGDGCSTHPGSSRAGFWSLVLVALVMRARRGTRRRG